MTSGAGATIELRVLPHAADLARHAAGEIAALARRVIDDTGEFVMALSGGSTPGPIYEHLAREWSDRIDWSAVTVIFGDDRCVPPDDPASNFRLASETLLSRVPIPANRVHRVRGELAPQDAALDYDRFMRGLAERRRGLPLVDLALQGVGDDGHTASIFPGSDAAHERQRLAVAVAAPEGVTPRARITLTFAALDRSREVYVLATGAGKRRIVQRVMRAPDEARQHFPAARLRGVDRTIWMVDADADGP